MNLRKKHLTVAVCAALGLGLYAQQVQASDRDLFFPYVVKDSNRTTIVTVMAIFGNPVSSGAHLHLQYWTKSTTDANTAACQPNSSNLTFTDNDIVSFDTAGILASGPLFGDTTNAAPLGTSISYAAPRHGYLHVSSSDENLDAGYWVEIDIANGGAHGDQAIFGRSFDNFNQNPGIADIPNADANALQTTSPWQSLHVGDRFSGTFNFQSIPHPVVFWPASTASTVFTVTPLGTAMETVENNQVILQVLNTNNVQGAYDRNENGVDGTVRQTVRCVGRLTAAQLMPGVVSNAAWAATGGWGWLANLGDGDTNYTEGGTVDLRAAVYQVDTSSAAGAGKFMQNTTRITSTTN